MVIAQCEEGGPKAMRKGACLNLSSTPEAKVALDMLRAQAAAGPYIHAGNLGAVPVRTGADAVRHAPLSEGGRAAYGRAIDAWLAAGGTSPFMAPVRLAPVDEARIHDGMAELCHQRRLVTAMQTGGHPTAAVAGALDAALRRAAAQHPGPRAIEGNHGGRPPEAQRRWARACRVAKRRGRAGDGALTATIFKNLSGDPLHKAHSRATSALAAARRVHPACGLEALAVRRCSAAGAAGAALAKRRGQAAAPAAPRPGPMGRAMVRLRDDQSVLMRPSGEGLRLLLAATGRMDRAARLAQAEDLLRRSRSAATRQERVDLCLLAQAHATLAAGGL